MNKRVAKRVRNRDWQGVGLARFTVEIDSVNRDRVEQIAKEQGLERLICDSSSAFHPNIAGAQTYAGRILSAIPFGTPLTQKQP